ASRLERLLHAGPVGFPDVEHEEPAPTRADQLAPDRAGPARRLVVLVERRIGHFARLPPLVLPVLVQDLAVAIDVTSTQQLVDLATERLDAMHAREALAFAAQPFALLGEHQ